MLCYLYFHIYLSISMLGSYAQLVCIVFVHTFAVVYVLFVFIYYLWTGSTN